MMSFPVCKQSLITRKRCEIEEKLQLSANSKSEPAYQNPTYIRGATPPRGEIGLTSFPICKQSLITWKRCEIEQKLQLTANSKSRSACQNSLLYLRC